MANTDRKKDIWHIPKRGNLHQTIFMVNVLTWEKYLNKSWSSGKQESIASEMSKAGLTKTGKALSHQSVRTLLANLPKYLGFVFIDESSTPSKIVVTEVGYKLINEHPLNNIPKLKKLIDYEKAKVLIQTSDSVQLQMSKLIITNPIIKNDCDGILLFPFRLTLKLLLELDYLDIEELSYIVFHSKSDQEIPVLVERIRNFRELSPNSRLSEINAYKKTPEGNLTLVKAASAGYYMYLCYTTGMCERISIKVNKPIQNKLSAIKLINKKFTQSIIKKYDGIRVYDFKNDWFLWKEYYSNPKRLNPPFDAKININSNLEFLISVEQGKNLIASGIIKNKSFSFPAFINEKYKISIYNLLSSTKIYTSIISFSRLKKDENISFKKVLKNEVQTVQSLSEKINQMFLSDYDGFDSDFYVRLITLRNVLGKNYFHNVYRGGRLENLFFELLSIAKQNKLIDEVFWYGKITEYGLALPAPGGKNGNPDIIFEIDNFQFVLELTTWFGNRSQWAGSEASSVPDHIVKFKETNPHKNTIGIFSAPSLHEQLRKNLKNNAKEEKVGMVFISCSDLADLFKKKRVQIINHLNFLVKSQMK